MRVMRKGGDPFGVIVKKLQDEFSFGGWDYKLIERTDKHFIYSKTSAFCERPAFEVFQRRILPEARYVRKGIEIFSEEQEAFPRDEHFGKWAWSGLCLEDSIRIASKIELHESAKGRSLE